MFVQVDPLRAVSIPIVFAVDVPMAKLILEAHSKTVSDGTLVSDNVQ